MILRQGSSNEYSLKFKVVCWIDWAVFICETVCGGWGMLAVTKVRFDIGQRFEMSDGS